MHEAEKLNLEQIEAFLKASEGIRFEGESRQQVYSWVEQVLRQQQYQKQGRKARGLLPQVRVPLLDANPGGGRFGLAHRAFSTHDLRPSTPKPPNVQKRNYRT